MHSSVRLATVCVCPTEVAGSTCKLAKVQLMLCLPCLPADFQRNNVTGPSFNIAYLPPSLKNLATLQVC
jgi:hypothetical protein